MGYDKVLMGSLFVLISTVQRLLIEKAQTSYSSYCYSSPGNRNSWQTVSKLVTFSRLMAFSKSFYRFLIRCGVYHQVTDFS